VGCLEKLKLANVNIKIINIKRKRKRKRKKITQVEAKNVLNYNITEIQGFGYRGTLPCTRDFLTRWLLD
jgi:hypothetical protein